MGDRVLLGLGTTKPTWDFQPPYLHAHSSSPSRGAQRSTRTNSPPSCVSSEAKSSPRRTNAGQPARSSTPATAHARGCCHLCRFNPGKPVMQMRRHWLTLRSGTRLVLELRGATGMRELPVIFRNAHSRLSSKAKLDSSPSTDVREFDRPNDNCSVGLLEQDEGVAV